MERFEKWSTCPSKNLLSCHDEIGNISCQASTVHKISLCYTHSQLDFLAIINKLLGSISLISERFYDLKSNNIYK